MREFEFHVEGDVIVAAHCEADALESLSDALAEAAITNCAVTRRGRLAVVPPE